MNRCRLIFLPLVAALLALTACSSATPGIGTPSGSPTNAPTGNGASVSSPTPAAAGLAAIQPCNLISSAQVNQNGLQPGGSTNEGGARNCNWSNPTADNGDGYSLEISLRDSQGLADINTDGLTLSDDNVGHHQGKQAEDTSAQDCLVFVGVASKSRVDIVVTTGNSDLTESCSLANHFAQLIEPELP